MQKSGFQALPQRTSRGPSKVNATRVRFVGPLARSRIPSHPQRMTRALRLATLADVPSLTRLIDASVRGLSVGYYSAEQIDRSLHSLFGPDSQLIGDGTYYVVTETDGRLAACGGWSKRRTLFGGDQHRTRDGDPLLDPSCESARIRALFVHPDAARQGLGRWIFETCRAAAEAAGFETLELAATLPGVPLYSSLGFRAIETISVPLEKGLSLPIVRMQRAIVSHAAAGCQARPSAAC